MEALSESQEVIDAKNARKAVKGTLSRVVNQLKVNLVIQPGAKYDFSKLDKFSIKADAEKLQTRLQNLQEKMMHIVKSVLPLFSKLKSVKK